jgi:Asp-tRNA(Asn)/Glu-tRNA(Gln) amidotransferase A subunit family amidase
MPGMSKSGLPLSTQLVAPVSSDRLLLGVAAAFECHTEWRAMRPPVS